MSKEAVKHSLARGIQGIPRHTSGDRLHRVALSHCTFELMIGMAPYDAITFVSALYAGAVLRRS